MVILSRTAPKLLGTVRGKSHATQDDHVDQLPTPPNSNSTRSSDSNARTIDLEEDINREPDSSGGEEVQVVQLDGPSGFKHPSSAFYAGHTVSPKATFKSSPTASLESTRGLKKPASGSQTSLGSKRSNDSDPDDAIFETKRPKKQRTGYSGNIHADPSKQKTTQYGKAAKAHSSKSNRDPSLKGPTKLETDASPPRPRFRNAIDADLLETMRLQSDPAPVLRPPRSSGDMRNSRSPSLSSLSSARGTPEVEEIEALDLPDAQPYTPQVECNICGCSVNKLLKEEFEDEHGLAVGKRMSYKWQQRFCRYHKRREAEDLWNEKGYPQIDWEGLERRMMKMHPHLEGVLNDTKPSFYRDELAEQQQKRKMKTAVQAFQSEDAKSGAPVGYYGPRGEKAMTDHIIQNLADKLRKRAAKDKLVASSGITGGVSGFVQAVLVPELTTKLVQEDLKLSDAEARNVIAESSELGGLLNPEIGEKVDKPQHVDDDER